MKKCLAYLFIIVIICSNTAIGQLLKLPTLFHHYNEHAISENASFIDFLTVHYQDQIDHPDDEHRDHENLPFKNVQQVAIFIVAQIPQQDKIELHAWEEIILLNRKNFNVCPNMSNSYLSSIWQPPRI